MSCVIEKQLSDAIHAALSTEMIENAVFLAEQLFAGVPNDATAQLLAKCYLRDGQPARAAHLLIPFLTPQSRYLRAISLYKQGEWTDAERVLCSSGADPVGGAGGFFLLGKLLRGRGAMDAAKDAFLSALQLDATLFVAYAALCELGEAPNAETVFDAHEGGESDYAPPQKQSKRTPMSTPVAGSRLSFATPVDPRLDATIDTPLSTPLDTPLSTPLDTPDVRATPADSMFVKPKAPVKSRMPQPMMTPMMDGPITPAPLMAAVPPLQSASPAPQLETQRSASFEYRDLNTMLALAGRAYEALCDFRCEEAHRRLCCLHETPWTLCMQGRAHFELLQFEQAAERFEELHRIAPYLTTGMDIFSTTLWQLKRASRLAQLAQHMSSLDRQAPETWCVVGNIFALAREHKRALKFFRRALQVNPRFVYAHTLAGHESAAEDPEEALSHYRNAVRLDPRHYNAWYGLGSVYYRQERFDKAEYHFRRALSIYPESSVLLTFCGMAAQARGRLSDASTMLDRAVQLAPHNTMARFKRASVCASRGLVDDAIAQLDELVDALPKEAPVYFLLGQLLASKGSLARSIAMLRIALDLAPRHSTHIRAALEAAEQKLADTKRDNQDDVHAIVDLGESILNL